MRPLPELRQRQATTLRSDFPSSIIMIDLPLYPKSILSMGPFVL